MQHDQTVGRKNDKIQPDLESKMAPMLKKEKKQYNQLFLKNGQVCLAEILFEAFV